MSDDIQLDWDRRARTGIPEVVQAEHKSVEQLQAIVQQCVDRRVGMFMTRVATEKADALRVNFAESVEFDALSHTLTVLRSVDADTADVADSAARIAIVAAGTSDAPVVAEIEQTLRYMNEPCKRYVDVGVAGLWRLTSIADELSTYPVIIAVAGMEGALFSVLAGLVTSPVIAVPVSVGYGVGQGGHVALNSALSSCVPGVAVVNIDNGFGAAALALKMLGASSAGDKSL